MHSALQAKRSTAVVIERLAALPIKTAVLIQYPRDSFEGVSIDEARKVRDLAIRYDVQVIDTYAAIKGRPLHETYVYGPWWPPSLSDRQRGCCRRHCERA